MIDLHTHSKYSTDGIEEVCDMLKLAESIKLKALSITDHNSCKAYIDLKDKETRNMFSGKIITGVELNTKVLGIPIEILGYNIDTNLMQKYIDETYLNSIERNKIELERLYEKCIKAGVVLPDNFVENYDGKIFGSKYLYQYIKENPDNHKFFSEASWNNSNIFYREYMSNPNTAFFVDMNDLLPDFELASEIVKESGGLVFLPHIFEYRENSEKILKFILENYKFDGIECYYRNFTEDQTKYLTKICKEYKLLKSGGSDYHGRVKNNIKMGTGEGNLNVPDDIINDWASFI